MVEVAAVDEADSVGTIERHAADAKNVADEYGRIVGSRTISCDGTTPSASAAKIKCRVRGTFRCADVPARLLSLRSVDQLTQPPMGSLQVSPCASHLAVASLLVAPEPQPALFSALPVVM